MRKLNVSRSRTGVFVPIVGLGIYSWYDAWQTAMCIRITIAIFASNPTTIWWNNNGRAYIYIYVFGTDATYVGQMKWLMKYRKLCKYHGFNAMCVLNERMNIQRNRMRLHVSGRNKCKKKVFKNTYVDQANAKARGPPPSTIGSDLFRGFLHVVLSCCSIPP